MTAPAPSFVVVSGASPDAEPDAAKLTERFIDSYKQGYRDLRNENLAVYYTETPRSRVGTVDGAERYGVIEQAAQDLKLTPVRPEIFVKLFLPYAAQQAFITYLGNLGLAAEFVNPLVTRTVDKIAYKNAQIDRLVGQQEGEVNVLSSAKITQLLADISRPVDVTSTQHLVEDFAENDALDADRKAHERLFSGFAQYIRDLLDL